MKCFVICKWVFDMSFMVEVNLRAIVKNGGGGLDHWILRPSTAGDLGFRVVRAGDCSDSHSLSCHSRHRRPAGGIQGGRIQS